MKGHGGSDDVKHAHRRSEATWLRRGTALARSQRSSLSCGRSSPPTRGDAARALCVCRMQRGRVREQVLLLGARASRACAVVGRGVCLGCCCALHRVLPSLARSSVSGLAPLHRCLVDSLTR
eukprot:1021185-Rhodomonas_salina.2